MSDSNFKFLIKPIIFIVALIASTILILWIEKMKPSDMGDYQTIFQREVLIKKSASYPLRKPEKLNEAELNYARIAWKYFENNYNKSTGFVNGIHGQPAVTIKDLGSYLMGMVSAYELGIIDSSKFDERIKAFSEGLNKINLCSNYLPGILYNSLSCKMTGNDPSVQVWSALDIGRFYSFVNKITFSYPQYRPSLKSALKTWNIESMISEGYLYAGNAVGKNITNFQEGTLGYEEYAAKNLVMAGYDANNALNYTDFIKFVDVYDNEIGIDSRGDKEHPLKNILVSEPYILDGIEYGWDNNSRELAFRLYKAQKERYFETGIVTAFCKEPINDTSSTYNCIYSNGKEWCSMNEKGEESEDLRILSTKAAFGWHSLFNDEYSNVLLNSVKHLNDPQKGWYAGKFEKSGLTNKVINAATNGIILEALNYKMNGRIIKF